VGKSDFPRNHFLLAEIGEPICRPLTSARFNEAVPCHHHVWFARGQRRIPCFSPSPLFDAPFGKTIVACLKTVGSPHDLLENVAIGLIDPPQLWLPEATDFMNDDYDLALTEVTDDGCECQPTCEGRDDCMASTPTESVQYESIGSPWIPLWPPLEAHDTEQGREQIPFSQVGIPPKESVAHENRLDRTSDALSVASTHQEPPVNSASQDTKLTFAGRAPPLKTSKPKKSSGRIADKNVLRVALLVMTIACTSLAVLLHRQRNESLALDSNAAAKPSVRTTPNVTDLASSTPSQAPSSGFTGKAKQELLLRLKLWNPQRANTTFSPIRPRSPRRVTRELPRRVPHEADHESSLP
jgi:hypothetical protein